MREQEAFYAGGVTQLPRIPFEHERAKLRQAPLASNADVLWGSSRVPAPLRGTRDTPLRKSAWEATLALRKWLKYIQRKYQEKKFQLDTKLWPCINADF